MINGEKVRAGEVIVGAVERDVGSGVDRAGCKFGRWVVVDLEHAARGLVRYGSLGRESRPWHIWAGRD